MGLFDRNNEPVFIKETSDLHKQLEQLQKLQKEPLTKEVAEKVEQEIRFIKAGIAGEDNIAFELKHSHMPMYILQDIYLEDGELSAQIDYLIVTKKLTFIVECKNLVGNIEINSKGDFIRTMNINKRNIKEGIYSPITQNIRHLELIKLLIGKRKTNIVTKALFEKFFYDNYKTVVVLANPKTVLNDKYAKKEIKDQVIRADQLINFIKIANANSKTAALSTSETEEKAKNFLAMHVEKDKDYTKKFSVMMENKEVPSITPETTEEKVCPKCNSGKLISRKGKFGSFIGCSNYPKCRFTMNGE